LIPDPLPIIPGIDYLLQKPIPFPNSLFQTDNVAIQKLQLYLRRLSGYRRVLEQLPPGQLTLGHISPVITATQNNCHTLITAIHGHLSLGHLWMKMPLWIHFTEIARLVHGNGNPVGRDNGHLSHWEGCH